MIPPLVPILPLPSKPFSTQDGEKHEVLFTGRGASAELKVHSVEKLIDEFFAQWAAEVKGMRRERPEKAKQSSEALAAADAKSQDVAKGKNALGRNGTPAAQLQKGYKEQRRRTTTRWSPT